MAEQNVNPPQDPPAAPRQQQQTDDHEEPISLVDEPDQPRLRGGGVRAFGAGTAAVTKKVEFRRELNVTGHGATRCRLFHSRIAIAPLQNLENQVNEWLDGEKVEIKHVGHVIGVMEGKKSEPNLLVMVWY